jgi:hypothetical protein
MRHREFEGEEGCVLGGGVRWVKENNANSRIGQWASNVGTRIEAESHNIMEGVCLVEFDSTSVYKIF